MERWERKQPSSDPVKMASELILMERGYSKDEASLGVSHFRDGIELKRGNIHRIVRNAKRYIDYARDDMRLGTDLYQGQAYFWHYKYRFYMRGDAHGNGYKGLTIEKARRIIHQRFLDENLKLSGSTQRHDDIINEVFGLTGTYVQ